jgi:hypothetical protein
MLNQMTNRKDADVQLTGVKIRSAVGVLTVSGGATVQLTSASAKIEAGTMTAKGESRSKA